MCATCSVGGDHKNLKDSNALGRMRMAVSTTWVLLNGTESGSSAGVVSAPKCGDTSLSV